MNRRIVIILVSAGIGLTILGVVLWLVFAGGVTGDSGTNEGGIISSESEEITKEEITTEKFKEKLESIVEKQFYVKIAESITDNPYEGLEGSAIVKSDNIVVASLDVYDSIENASAVIADVKGSNTAGYKREAGKNFEKISSENSLIEQVGKTILTVNTDDSEITEAILKAIRY